MLKVVIPFSLLSMQILTINVGSSSVRLAHFEFSDIDNYKLIKTHRYEDLRSDLRSEIDKLGTINVLNKIDAIAHRFVCSSKSFTSPSIITKESEDQLKNITSMAPLHLPIALNLLNESKKIFCKKGNQDETTQVALFDSAFFNSLPDQAAIYPLPKRTTDKYSIRRVGFHGLAHEAMWRQWSKSFNDSKKAGKVISIQLGSGCSICAISDGKPIDTSMGLTPMEGLMMSTRCGDIDPGVILYLQKNGGLSLEDIEKTLNYDSGLLGVSGKSGDMRKLLSSDDPQSKLAIEIYCYKIKKYIGAYIAALNGADAIIFGGGVGEHSPLIREKVLGDLSTFGISLDILANKNSSGKLNEISGKDSKIKAYVIPVNEEKVMAKFTYQFLKP